MRRLDVSAKVLLAKAFDSFTDSLRDLVREKRFGGNSAISAALNGGGFGSLIQSDLDTTMRPISIQLFISSGR